MALLPSPAAFPASACTPWAGGRGEGMVESAKTHTQVKGFGRGRGKGLAPTKCWSLAIVIVLERQHWLDSAEIPLPVPLLREPQWVSPLSWASVAFS